MRIVSEAGVCAPTVVAEMIAAAEAIPSADLIRWLMKLFYLMESKVFNQAKARGLESIEPQFVVGALQIQLFYTWFGMQMKYFRRLPSAVALWPRYGAVWNERMTVKGTSRPDKKNASCLIDIP